MTACHVKRRPAAFAAFFLCLWPLHGEANAGVPLFGNYVVYSWLLLIPIIGIEAYVLRKRLTVSTSRASAVAALANIASTIVGTVTVVAISFLLAVGLGMSESMGAMGDITVLIALIPCFFLSAWIEMLVAAPLLKQVPREAARAAVYMANQFSYVMLAVVPIARFIKNAIVQGQITW